jgi:hypothetical protein
MANKSYRLVGELVPVSVMQQLLLPPWTGKTLLQVVVVEAVVECRWAESNFIRRSTKPLMMDGDTIQNQYHMVHLKAVVGRRLMELMERHPHNHSLQDTETIKIRTMMIMIRTRYIQLALPIHPLFKYPQPRMFLLFYFILRLQLLLLFPHDPFLYRPYPLSLK